MAANKCLLAQAVRGDVLHRVNAGRFFFQSRMGEVIIKPVWQANIVQK